LSNIGFPQFQQSTQPKEAVKTEQPEVPSTQAPTPTQQNDTQTKDKLGISASDIYPDIFGDQPDTNEADLVNRYLNSAEGQLFLERQNLTGMTNEAKSEALKTELEGKYKADLDKLEE